MRLADVVAARASWPKHISWCAIFIKAYAIVAKERPELRRAMLTFPWKRIYEHPENVASFGLERDYQNELSVFFGKIASPEQLSLVKLDKIVRSHKSAPIETVPSYRHALLLSRVPQPLRWLLWWMALSWEGPKRAWHFGTFGISVVASLGAAGIHILSPLTTTLNYGMFEPDGSIDVRLVYDHRVLDGAVVARAMAALEEVLHNVIVPELLAGEPGLEMPAVHSGPSPVPSSESSVSAMV